MTGSIISVGFRSSTFLSPDPQPSYLNLKKYQTFLEKKVKEGHSLQSINY
jgi:hypothetical protein